MNRFSIMLALFVLAAAVAAQAQIITDRPDFADAATPVPVGTLQVESGYLFGKTPGVDQHTVGQWLVKTGLCPKAEIRLGINSYEKVNDPAGDVSGFSDGSLGLKFRLLEGEAETGPGSFNLSTIIFSGLPSGDDNFRSRHLAPGVMLTSDMALGEAWTWAPFVQYVFTEDGLGQYGELSAGFSLVRSLSGSVSWFAEYFVTVAEDGYREDKNFLGTGFTWLLNDSVQLDCYGGSALNGVTPDYYLGAGLSFALSRSN